MFRANELSLEETLFYGATALVLAREAGHLQHGRVSDVGISYGPRIGKGVTGRLAFVMKWIESVMRRRTLRLGRSTAEMQSTLSF